MPLTELRYGVWLGQRRVGFLHQRGDYTWFRFDESYLNDRNRPVLGLVFEQNLHARHASALRLPPWFSNLLPEGRLREWVAEGRGVSADREMELLAQVGGDLPGAVRVLAEDTSPEDPVVNFEEITKSASHGEVVRPAGWRFSLAGVRMKFSLLRTGDRLTAPASGRGGDWIVKLPDAEYSDVPTNEYVMMKLASIVGLDVPEVVLVHRDEIEGIPSSAWKSSEEWAYAVRRFDRLAGGGQVHIEDLAQVRNVYSDRKYDGNFETVASLIYRRRDIRSLQEFSRRLAFNILISNGDAHLKNWSLIYRDSRVPEISPAYDLVSTAPYRDPSDPEDLGLKFGGTRIFDRVSVASFSRLEQRLNARDAHLADHVADLVRKVEASWTEVEDLFSTNQDLRRKINVEIGKRTRTLLGK
ncbi:type II toxin-antitoxin system HipA family toxin [Streptomyces aureus]|uniref:type II toxin-antitoxin system HipA family toxin n=1 Tax=Streptomyces aureus TaxID=193461 RepID=UPI0033ED1BD9